MIQPLRCCGFAAGADARAGAGAGSAAATRAGDAAGGAAGSAFAAIGAKDSAGAGTSGLLAVTSAGSGASILAATGGAAGAGVGLAAATTTGAGCGAGGSGLTATTGAGAAGAAATTGAGSDGAGADTCIGASDAVCVPAFTDSVFTSTGRIGSVEPAAVRGCATAAIDSVLVVAGSVCAAGAELSRTGKLTALATANRASALGSGFASVLFASVLAATFGSGFASTLAATFGSGAVSTLATVLGSGLASGGGEPSATIGAVRLTEAWAILSLIRSRIFASRLPALLPPITTATR